MKSSELLALPNLANYRLAVCYWAQLQHGLMGCFPAVIAENEEMFVCLDKNTLELILEQMPRRRFRITENLMLVNDVSRVAFDIEIVVRNRAIGHDSESVPVIFRETLAQMRKVRMPKDPPLFKWAPGLVGDDMTLEEFRETMDAALAKAEVKL